MDILLHNNTFKVLNPLIFMEAKKQITLSLILLLVVFGGSIFVASEPPMPFVFYGNFTHLNKVFPNGHFLIAKINGVVSGECPIVNQKFGDSGSCVVISYEDNVPIEFYLGETKIGESTFNKMERVNLNFVVDFIPELIHVPSNGICEIELDECSYNILDCNVIVSNVCIGNGICEPHLGETCSNSPKDCGACPSSGGASSSTGSSGGSSGGGGNGGGLSSITTSSINSNEENESTGLGISLQDSNEQESLSIDEKPRRGISGFAIFGGNEDGKSLWWIWILLLLLIFFFLIRKYNQNKKETFDKKLNNSVKNGVSTKPKKRPVRKKVPNYSKEIAKKKYKGNPRK